MNKKVVVTVDIQAQATQLNNIIEQSKKSLNSLSLSPKMDNAKLKELQNILTRIQNSTGTLQTNLASGLSSPAAFTKASKDINALYQQYLGFAQKVAGLNIDVSKIFPNTPEVTKLLTDISKKTEKKAELIGRRYGKGIDKGLDQAMAQASQKGNTAEIKRLEKQAKAANTAAHRSDISRTAALGKKYGTNAEGASTAIQKELDAYRRMSDSEQRQYRAKTGRNIDTFKQDLSTAKKYDTYKQEQGNITKASGQYQQQATEIQQLVTALGNLSTKLQQLAGPTQQDAANGLNHIASSADQVEQQTREMGDAIDKSSRSFEQQSRKMGQLSQLKSYIGYMFSITQVVMRAGRAIRNAITDIKNLDKQLNEISIVTGKTMEELWGGFGKLNSAAQRYGVTTGDVVSVQKLYYQQGRSVAEVNELTGETLTFAKISGLEFAEATEYMTAALNAFKIEAKDSSVITDVYAALSANAAVDAKEVAVAMSKVASLAATSGSTLEETSAYLTKIIETTREAPETAGTALKTVIARFTAVNKLTEDQAELLDEDYNFNNIEKALKTVGISVKDSVGQMRSFTDIIEELGPKWDGLTSNQKHYIATQAAGARQQSRFIALMDDWSRTQELQGVAADSAGTGAKQLALSMDSIDSKLKQLKASWQSFYGSVTSSNLAKFFIDLANGILKLINSIGELGAWGTALTVLFGTLIGVIIKWAINFGKTFAGAFMGAYNTSMAAHRKKQEIAEVANHYKRGYAAGVAFAEGEAAGKASGKVAGDISTAATSSATSIVTATGLGAGASAAGAGAGAGLGKAAAGVMKFIIKALPYVAIAAVVVGAVLGSAKLNQILANKDNKKAGETVAGAQTKANEALEKQEALTKSYTKALELQRKGLARTEEETEEYQKLLTDLQIQYPGIIKKTKDGLLELTEQSEAFIENQKAVNTANLEAAQQDVLYNADKAFAVGKYATTEANDINDELKSVFSTLSEKTDEELKKMGGTGAKVKTDNLTKLAEQGLSYEAMEEALGKGLGSMLSTFNADIYNDYIQEFARLTNENKLTVELNESDMFNSPNGKKVLSILNALNQQAGTNIVDELVQANDYSSIIKEQVGQIANDISATNGVNISEEVKTLMQEEAADQVLTLVGTIDGEITDAIKQEQIALIDKYIEGVKEGGNEKESRKTDSALHVSIFSKAKSKYIEGEITEEQLLAALDASERSTALYRDATLQGTGLDTITSQGWYKYDNKDLKKDWANIRSKISQEVKEQNEDNIKAYAGMDSSTRSRFENQVSAMSKMSLNSLREFEVSAEALDEETAEYQQTLFERARENNEKILKDYITTIETLSGITLVGLKNLAAESLNQFAGLAKTMASKYAKEAVARFSEAYLEFYTNALSENAQLASAFAEVDLFNTESIAKFAAKARTQLGGSTKAYDSFVNLVNNSSSVLDRDFENLTQAISSSANAIKNLKEQLELLQKGFDEGLDIEEMGELLSKYPDLLDLDDINPTADGLKISTEDANKVKETMIIRQLDEYQELYWLNNAHLKGYWNAFSEQAKLSFDEIEKMKNYSTLSKEEQDKINKLIESKGLTGDWAQVQQLQEVTTFYKKMHALTNLTDFEYEANKKVLQERIDKLETILDLLEKINEYADIDGLIGGLTNKLDRLNFEIEFSTNTDNLEDSIKDKFSTLGNLVSANLAKAEQATANTAARRQAIEQGEFSKYVKFDEDGNLMRDEEGLAAWAEKIGNIDISTDSGKDAAEREKKRFELFMDSLEAYEEEKDLINECTAAAEDYTKQIEDFDKELNQNVVDLEDKFRELMIKRDEEAVDTLEKRYDAMKEADQDYLDSVREAVEEERRLRDQDKAKSDLTKMERQLELLRMSGGSATQIQELEQQINETRQDINDTEIDNRLEAIEKEADKRAENYDEEVQYQQAVLEAKKENQIAYNAEIAALMSQDKETIMNTWKILDNEFLTSTETNKALLETAMEQMVASGLASKNALADEDDGYIPTIRKAYEEVKDAIGNDSDAMTNFVESIAKATTPESPAIKGIGEIEKAYSGVYSMIDITITRSGELLKELEKVVAYKDKHYKYFEGGTGSYTPTKQPIGGNQLGIVEEKFTTEKGLGWNGEAETWYKINGQWYTHRQLTDANVDVGGQAIIKSGEENKFETDESQEELLLQRFYSNLYRGGAADKAFTETNIDAQTERGLGLIPVNSSSSDTIQTYKNANYNDTKNKKWTPSQIADSVWFAGVQNNFVKLRDDGNDSTYYITLSDFMKYFNVGFVEKLRGYSEGGLVDFTGPAMVHGSTSKPEAFLSAKDTVLIAGLRDVLRANFSGSVPQSSIQKSGDIYYEIHINVDELGDGYSVDDLVDEMEERILQATGNNTVIKVK